MRLFKCLICLFVFISAKSSFAQSFDSLKNVLQNIDYSFDSERRNVDSLLQVYEATVVDTEKVNILLDIEYEYYPYYIEADSLILQYIRKQCNSFLKGNNSENDTYFYKWNFALATRYLANNFENQGYIDSALSFGKRSVELFEEIGDTVETANGLNDIGNIVYESGDYGKSLRYYLKSLKLRQSINEQSEYTIRTLLNVGSTYQDLGQINTAIQYYNKAVNMALNINKEEELSTIYSAIGTAYYILKENDVSLEYFAKTKKLLQKHEFKNEEALLYLKLGNIYHSSDENMMAIAYYDSSISCMNQNNIDEFKGDIYNNKALTYKSLLNYDSAHFYQQKALEFFKLKQDVVGVAGAYANLSDFALNSNNFKKALNLLLKAESTIEQTSHIEFKRNIYQKLSNLFNELKQYQAALNYHKKFVELEQQITKDENQKSLWKYQYQSEYEAQAREDSLRHEQQMQVAALELQNTQYKNTLWSSVAGGVFLLALAIILWLRARAQKRLEERNAKAKAEVVKAMIVGQEKERSRISKELHDGVGADLLAAKFKLNSQQNTPGYEILENTISSIRNFSHDLIPPRLDLHSIEEYLAEYFNALRDDVPFNIRYNYIGNFKKLNIDEKITLYRITQECLTNIIKHAEASEVIAQLTEENGNITLLIEDDGKGFASTKLSDGIGLSNIKSRIELLGGNVQVDSTEGKGATVLVQFKSSFT